MSNRRSRGLIFFVLIAVVAGLGGVGIWLLRKPKGVADGEATTDSRAAGDTRRLVKGTGTSWLEEEAPGEASAAIEGIVLDADGKGVDGALVTLARAWARGEEVRPGGFWQPRGVASTAGGGRFRIDKLIPGDYGATAVLAGWAPGFRQPIPLKEKETATIEIKLARGGATLSGRVLDVGGGAIPGARVTTNTGLRNIGRVPSLVQTVSGPDGQYYLTLAPGPLSVRVEAEGYAPLTDYSILLVRPLTRDLRLVPAARLSGRVVERRSKQPVADAEVSLTSPSRTEFRQPRDGKADGNGRFEFTGLEPGTYEVTARKGMLIGTGQSVGLAVAGTVTDVEVEVDRGFVLSGRVKDEKGTGLGGIQINASREGTPFPIGQSARTKSNPDGTYALEGMLPGSYRLSGREEGFGSSSARAKVVASDVVNVDLVLPIAARVSGRVVTAEGKPVEGARVRAMIETRSAGGGTIGGGDSASSGPDGTFELKRITSGTLQVSVQDDQHGVARLGPEEVKAGEAKVLRLVLKKGASVSGTVKTEDGRPAPDVRVSGTVQEGMMFSDSAQDVSGPDGRYRLAGLSGGRVIVQASRAGRESFGGPDEEPNRKTLTMAEGEDRAGVDLVVSPAGLALKGTVTTPDGKPVFGAIVSAGLETFGRAFRSGGQDLRAYSQLDGQFAIENVTKRPYTLWASHPDHPEAELKGVAGGSTAIKLSFAPDTSVSGLVVTPEGKPITHYTITLLPGPKPDETPIDRRRRQMSTFDARTQRVQSPEGAFEVRRLAAGTHELQVSGTSGETGTQVVTLAAGERKAGLRIQVQPGVRVTGRVLEHGSGKPLPGVAVRVSGQAQSRAEAETNPEGHFLIEGAPTGENIRLSVQGDFTRWVPESKELEMKPGQSLIDAGTIKLLPGNMRDRMTGPPAERGTLGGSVGLENGRVVVRGLQPDGPAARLGVKKGDLVTAIGRTSTSDLGSGALSYLTAGKPGDQVTLMVESPGTAPRPVTITLEAWKAPTPPARSN